MDDKTKTDLLALAKELDAATANLSAAFSSVEGMNGERLLRLYPAGYPGRLEMLNNTAAALSRVRMMAADVAASMDTTQAAKDGTARRQ